MGAPKKPRNKVLKEELKYPAKSTPKKNHYFSNLMKTPEGRALRKQWSTKPKRNAGRPVGALDGYTAAQLVPIREKARAEADKVVSIMSSQFDINDEYSKEALRAAVSIMREPAQNRDKLTAARLVLDFTRSKPAASVEVTVGKAESFLSSLLIEHDGPQDDEQLKIEVEESTDDSIRSQIGSSEETPAK